MSKALFVFLCALVLKISVAAGSEVPAGGTIDKAFLLAENDADLFASNATVTDAAPTQVVPTVPKNDVAPTQPTQAVQPSAVTQPSAPISSSSGVPNIYNNVTVSPQQAAARDDGAAEAAAILSAKAKEQEDEKYTKTSIIPMVGASGYAGRWNQHISNDITFGLALEFPLSRRFSLEGEADYARYRISYSYFSHPYTLYSFGGNAKVYLLDKSVRPYIGAGLLGNYYENMSHGPSAPDRYSQIVGSGQFIVGSDVELANDFAVGLRGAWISPLFNRARTQHNGVSAYPYYEEAAAMDTSFYRIMATTKISF